jgi:4-amino-4-deoxy-L-arabinose transferase-like glycosyltransferase
MTLTAMIQALLISRPPFTCQIATAGNRRSEDALAHPVSTVRNIFEQAPGFFMLQFPPVPVQGEPFHICRAERVLTPVALLLVLLPYGIHVGTPSLWDANEAFYVEGPREMQEAGDWLTPRFNFAEKLNKPILPYWLVLLSFRLFGVSEWAERVVILASIVATVLVTYRLGLLLGDRRTALWGALIVATSPKVIMVARRSLIDALLTAMSAVAIYGLLSGWCRRDRARLVLGYAALGASVLTKGLVGVVLPAGAFTSYLLLTRRFAALRHLRLGLGALISLGIAAPWFAVMTWREGGEYLRSFFIGEHVSRYLQGTHGARRPIWYYLPTLLGEFAPWSFFLPLAIVVACRSFRSDGCGRGEERSSPLSSREGHVFLLGWFLFGLVFFSLSAAKQNEYLLPLYPAAALLVAHLFGVLPQVADTRIRRGFLLTVGGVSVALLIAARLLWDAARILFPNHVLASLSALALVAALPGLAWGGWRQRPIVIARVLVATIAVLHAALAGLLPEIERYRPVRPLAERIRQEAGPEDLVGYYRYTAPSLCYYTRRKIFEIFTPEELQVLLRSGRRTFCLMREQDARELSVRYGLVLRIRECRPSLFPLRIRELRRLQRSEDLERVCVVTNW